MELCDGTGSGQSQVAGPKRLAQSIKLNTLTASREVTRAQPWTVADAPRDYIQAQMRAIVGIEIEISMLEGKWKVSQSQPEANRRSVAARFSTDESTREMAELLRIYGKLE